MRIGVISHSLNPLQAQPERYVSKNAAECLLRRLLAVRITKSLVMMVPPHQAPNVPNARAKRGWSYEGMQHHIEPRIERIPELDRLVAEWQCAEHYWAT
jgi:hypothetical protein